MKYIKNYEYKTHKELYLCNEIKFFVDWFYEKYGEIAEYNGWSIFNSSGAYYSVSNPDTKYINEDKYRTYYQIQKLDEAEILSNDTDAEKKAKEIGIMIDEFGLVVGFNGIDFIKNPERIQESCYINKQMEYNIKEYNIKKDANKYNL